MSIWERIEELRSVSRRRMAGCHPALQSAILHIIEVAAFSNLYFAVFMGLRTWAQQDALYAQGREPLQRVNFLRGAAGMEPIADGENKMRVTNARGGESFHQFGLAVDLVQDGDPAKIGLQWSWRHLPSYLALGAIVMKAGLNWGGMWKSVKDYPHAEMTFGVTLADAQEVYTVRQEVRDVWSLVNARLPDGFPRG